MSKCSLSECDHEIELPAVRLELVNVFKETFEFCSANHALYFLAFPEKHWPMHDIDDDLNIGITG